MDEVHFHIVKFAVYSVLRGCVDMGLHNSEHVGTTTVEGELHLSTRDTGLDVRTLGVNCRGFVCVLLDEEIKTQIS